MLTRREHALSIFNCSRGMRFGHVLGADQDEIRRGRLHFLDQAISAVERAYSEPRLFVQEPNDETLNKMLDWLKQRRELVT
jgi:hypothetical protein